MARELMAALNLTPGRLYDYAPIGKDGVRRVLGVYRVLGTARDARTRQESVVYEAVLGGEAGSGQWYHCPFMDFTVRFLPHEPANGRDGQREADPPPPEKPTPNVPAKYGRG